MSCIMCKRAVPMPLSDPTATGIYICGKCASFSHLLRADMQYDLSGQDQSNDDDAEIKVEPGQDEEQLEVDKSAKSCVSYWFWF